MTKWPVQKLEAGVTAAHVARQCRVNKTIIRRLLDNAR